ncbi:F-box/WD repeat-containing protein 12 isoform X2 [Stigmatopora nigra]
MDLQILTRDCIIHIFSFLTEEDLIRASSVSKDWHDVAETQWLWRRMCLQRWGFCSQAVLASPVVNYSWKTYFLRRSHLETKMKEGRTGDYTCRSLRGHVGQIVGLVYLQENSPLNPDLWNTPATVCSASTDGTVRAWNTQNGQLMWCSAKQSPLSSIISDEQRDFVITADSTGLIKVWQGQTGKEVASNSASSTHCTLLQYNKDNEWFLSVGKSQGSLCTLSGTSLTERSSIMVIYTDSLTSLCEDEDPLCQFVPVTGCQAAVFVPTQSARLAMVHCKERSNNKALTVFDVIITKSKYTSKIQVQQVESFSLPMGISSNILLEAKDSNSIVMAVDRDLWMYSMKGSLLARFTEHTMPITSMCVDSFRVVTASQDLSLHVLAWKHDSDRGLVLESRYHLLGGSHTMSKGFSIVACDFSSIVGSVQGKDGKDILKAYTFTS